MSFKSIFVTMVTEKNLPFDEVSFTVVSMLVNLNFYLGSIHKVAAKVKSK